MLSLSTEDALPLGLERGTLRLRRAWPRSGNHLLLEFISERGELAAAQWMRDPARLEKIAEETRAGAPAPERVRIVEVRPSLRVLLQTGGADRVLRPLAPLLAQPGRELIVHRPERRAVVRSAGSATGEGFIKVMPQRRLQQLVERERILRQAPMRGFALPSLLKVDEAAGAIAFAAAPGASLHDLLESTSIDTMRAVGRALRGLHHVHDVSAVLSGHGPAEEVGVLSRWLGHLRAFDSEAAALLEPESREVIRELEHLHQHEMTVIHRDFYDKQVFVDTGRRITLLDFDTLAIGDPALDLGNMIAHLHHRAGAGRLDSARAAELSEAFLSGYECGDSLLRRVGVYQRAARLRLACVHAFRPPFQSQTSEASNQT